MTTISDLWEQAHQFFKYGRVTNYHKVSSPEIHDRFLSESAAALLPINGNDWEEQLLSTLYALTAIPEVENLPSYRDQALLFAMFRRLRDARAETITVSRKALYKERSRSRFGKPFRQQLEDLQKSGLVDLTESKKNYLTINGERLMQLYRNSLNKLETL